MVLKRPLTSSEAGLLTAIDASFNIFTSQMDMDGYIIYVCEK